VLTNVIFTIFHDFSPFPVISRDFCKICGWWSSTDFRFGFSASKYI